MSFDLQVTISTTHDIQTAKILTKKLLNKCWDVIYIKRCIDLWPRFCIDNARVKHSV